MEGLNTIKIAISRGQVIVQEVNETFIFFCLRTKRKRTADFFLFLLSTGGAVQGGWHVIVSPIAHRQTVNKIRSVLQRTQDLCMRGRVSFMAKEDGSRRCFGEDRPDWESRCQWCCGPCCIVEHALQHY